MKNTKLVCEYCRNSNIEKKAWIDPNTDEITSIEKGDDIDEQWCNDCEEHVSFLRVPRDPVFKHPEAHLYNTGYYIEDMKKTLESPETWNIDVLKGKEYYCTLMYDNEENYLHDLKMFGLYE